jgi:hypothetical protein
MVCLMTSEAENVVEEDLVTCSRCGGEGEETYEEDGRTVTDPCYHCAGLGRVSEETAFADRVAAAASVLAARWVSDYRKACDNDPYGDGFGLLAAENGVSTRDYVQDLKMTKGAEFARELATLSPSLKRALVEELVPEPEPIAVPVTTPLDVAFVNATPNNDNDADEEIPF